MVHVDEILKSLPHTFPFRMVDRILEIEPGKRAVALKAVSVDDFFLQGHFPRGPVMPVVFILEAMAQTGGIAFHSLSGTKEGAIPYLARVEKFRSKKRVVPGDRMILIAEIEHIFSHLAKVKVIARVEEEIAAEGVLVLAHGSPTDNEKDSKSQGSEGSSEKK